VSGFLVRRLVLAALVLAVFSFVSFLILSHLQPTNGIPVLTQYWTWLRGVPTGRSLHTLLHGTPSRPAVVIALGHTLVLLAVAMVLVVVLSIALATSSARWRGSAVDVGIRGVSYLGWAVPAFLLALVVQQVVSSVGNAHGLGPFPVAGWPGSCPAAIGQNYGTLTPCASAGTGAVYVGNVLRYVTLPAIVLAVGFVGLHGRYLRSSLLEVLDAPFVTTARAKGLSERAVIRRHALRASMATFAGALLADFGVVFGAALAVDWVFQFGGLGTLYINEFNSSTGFFDLYSVEALVLVTAVLVLVSALLGELSVYLLDPRVRAQR